MHPGKPVKLALTWSHRRIRLGVSHHGSPSAWTAPTKDVAQPDRKPHKKRR